MTFWTICSFAILGENVCSVFFECLSLSNVANSIERCILLDESILHVVLGCSKAMALLLLEYIDPMPLWITKNEINS